MNRGAIDTTLEELGIGLETASREKLATVLEMLIAMPDLLLMEWRRMFGVEEDFAAETLEQIWHTENKKLREAIFHCKALKLGETRPGADWMTETLAEYIGGRHD